MRIQAIALLFSMAVCNVDETHFLSAEEAAEESVPECGVEDVCQAVVLSTLANEATVGWRICCLAGDQAVAIPQVGAGLSWGDNDSAIVDCGVAYTSTLSLQGGSGSPWVRVDTLEWPFDQDSVIGSCGSPGSPQ